MAESTVTGQAMAMILARRLPGIVAGQATADIFQIYIVSGNANARTIKFAKQAGYAQANARVKGINVPTIGQARAVII